MIGQDLGEQLLHVIVRAATNNWRDAFDFHPDFATEIDLAFHTANVARSYLKRKDKMPLFSALISRF